MKPDKPRLEAEAVYRLGYEEEWGQVINLLRRHRDQIAQDERLQIAFAQTLEGWFFTDWSAWDPIVLNDALEKLFYLYLGGALHLPERHVLTSVSVLVDWYKDRNLQKAYQLARAFPDQADFKPVIAKYNNTIINNKISGKPYKGRNLTTSLFKSKQEEQFFYAVRQVFPSFAVHPNVALSALVDFQAIQGRLSGEEAAYFFRAVVDCVVFDQHKRYVPVYFFELDSVYHEQADQQHRDHMKDRIISLAGKTVQRIRVDDNPSVDAYIRVLRQALSLDKTA